MKKFLIILYLGFVTLGCIFENTSNKKLPPKVENGILDLRDWNFAKDGIVSLDGEWEFYPNEFLRTVPLWDTDRIKIDAEKNFIQVPSKWESFKKNGESIDKFHFASYRIKILLPNADNYLSIHLPSIGASYSFFVNGVLIANAGNPARIKEEYIPAYNQGVFDFQYDQEDIEIIVQAASFDYQNGSGLWEPLLLGLSSNINVIARKNAIIDAMTIGTLLIMALYHFSFFFIRRKEASAFFFGLFCFCMAIRVSVFGGRIITDFLYIFHNYFLIVKAEILSLYLLLPSFIKYIQNIFPENLKKDKFLSLLFYICIFYVVLGTFTPIEIYTKNIFIISIQGLIGITLLYIFTKIPTLLIEKRDGVSIFSFSVIVNLLTVTNDILLVNNFLNTVHLGPFGFLTFVFSQAFLLSSRYSKSFQLAENLSEDLEKKSNHLEETTKELSFIMEDIEIKIAEGVKEQQKFNRVLLELNKSKTITRLGFLSALEELSETCAKTLNVERCSIWITEYFGKRLSCINLYDLKEDMHCTGEKFTTTDFPIYMNYFKDGNVLSAPDVFEHPAEIEFNEIYHRPLGIQSTLEISILSGGKLLGVLVCETISEKKYWTPEEENFVSSLAGILSSYFEFNEKQETFLELAETKKEIEDLNQFTHLINSLSDLNEIFLQISTYMYQKYSITGSWLLLPDERKENLTTYKSYSYIKLPSDKYNYIMTKKIPMKDVEGGMIYKTFQKKKSFYLSKIPENNFSIDKDIIKTLYTKSLLLIPVLRKEESIGILAFSNLDKEMKLSKKQILSISNLCSQIAGAIDSTYLLQQVERAKRETDALNEISKSVNSNLDLNHIIESTMNYIRENFDIELCSLNLVKENKNKITLSYLTEHPAITKELFREDIFDALNLEDKNHVFGYVYQAKQTLYTKELTESVNPIEKGMIDAIKLKSFLCIPLILKEEVIGILGFGNYNRLMPLSSEEITNLEKIASQLTGAIYNSRLLEETQKAKQKIESFNLLLKKINETSDLEEIMSITLGYMKDKYKFPYYVLTTLDSNTNQLKHTHSILPDYISPEEKAKLAFGFNKSLSMMNPESIHFQTITKGKPIFIQDAETEIHTEFGKKLFNIFKHKSFITLPILLQNKAIGTLDFISTEPVNLSIEDTNDFSLLSEQLAGAIQSSLLLEQVKTEKEKALVAKVETEKAKAAIERIAEAVKLANSSDSLLFVVQATILYLEEEFHFDTTWLLLVDENMNCFFTHSFVGNASREKIEFFQNLKIPIEIESGTLYSTYLRKKIFYLPKLPKKIDNIDAEIVKRGDGKFILQVPLVIQDKTIGILNLTSTKEVIKLSKSDLSKLQLFADQIAGAVYNSYLSEKTLQAKEEVEKQKRETEELNELIKSLNEDLNIGIIMQKVMGYVLKNFNVKYYSLYIPTTDKTKVKLFDITFPDFISEHDRNIIRNSEIPIDGQKGAHTFTFKSKRPFFISNVRSKLALNTAVQEEIFVIEKYRMKSMILIPLLLQNEIIGCLNFTNESKMELSKSDLTRLSILGEQLAGIIHGSNLFKQVQEEKEKANKAKQEVDRLNEFTRLINSTSDIDIILKEVYSFLNQLFGIESIWILLVDKETEELYSNPNMVISKDEKFVDSTFFKNFRMKLNEKLGLFYETYKKKAPFYLPDFTKTQVGDRKNVINEYNQDLYKASRIDIQIALKGNAMSNIQFPFIVNNEVIGILLITAYQKIIELGKQDLEKLVRFADQIAGVIHNAQLLKETEEAKLQAESEREKANIAKQDAEKQKQETENLNKLIKSLNEDLNIKIIMQKVAGFVRENFGIHHYGLYISSIDKKEVHFLDATFPEYVTKPEIEKIKTFSIPITTEKGAHSFTFKTKKPFYVPKVQSQRILNSVTEEELFVIQSGRIESFLLIPLILQNEPIGILDFSNEGKMELSKDDITRLSILGEQLAGIIRGSNLFKQVQEEKEKTELAKLEIQALNEFSKIINASNDLNKILDLALTTMNSLFSIDFLWLHLVDKVNKEIYSYAYRLPNSVGILQQDLDFLFQLKVRLSENDSSMVRTYEGEKIVYIPNIKRISKSSLHPLDGKISETFNFSYQLQVPLIVNQEVIGILHLNSFNKKIKFKKQDLEKISRFAEQLSLAVNNSALYEEAESERNKSEKLLLNILPKDVARELKEKGFAEPELFENVTVMFTDFKGFTQIAETLTPQELIKDLDACFVQFDKITERVGLEKLKTIGDSYMCAGGIPRRNSTHAVDCALAALEIQSFMNMMRRLKEEKGFPYWELRLGIHSGPLVAGVIGERKFAYDVWGDTVNTASRMESSGTPGRINISYTTYELVKDFFDCEYRGEVSAKNKGVVKMYYLNRIRAEFSKDEVGLVPNEKFWSKFSLL